MGSMSTRIGQLTEQRTGPYGNRNHKQIGKPGTTEKFIITRIMTRDSQWL
jgi:hypothetical protein